MPGCSALRAPLLARSVLGSVDALFVSTGVMDPNNTKWRADVFPFGSKGGPGPLLPALARLRSLGHLEIAHLYAGLEVGIPEEWCRAGAFPSLIRWVVWVWAVVVGG